MASKTAHTHWSPAAIGDLTGQTALITGANGGIGERTAQVLAGHGARVILTGRSQAALDASAADIRAAHAGSDVQTAMIDLGRLASIANAVQQLAATERIDMLINNAGVMNIPERRETADGLEMTVGINHLGHFALTAGLMPALRRAQGARVVTVSALAGGWKRGALDDLMSEQSYGAMTAYAKSKRANIVFTAELARRLAGNSMKAIVVHPGSAMTDLQRHSQGLATRIMMPLLRHTMMGSPEGAAWPSLFAATYPEVGSGQFIAPAGTDQTSGTPKVLSLPRGAGDPEEGARLWAASERLTGIRFEI